MTTLREDTGSGTPGRAVATLRVLRDPRESRSVEVLPRGAGGGWVVVRHPMDSWGLWQSAAWPVVADSVCRLVRSASSREALLVDLDGGSDATT